MKKGSEIAFDLKNVDCDPRIKNAIIELAEQNYYLYKQLLECNSALNYMCDILNQFGTATDEIKKKIESVKKEEQND